jgi:hypothetical protein
MCHLYLNTRIPATHCGKFRIVSPFARQIFSIRGQPSAVYTLGYASGTHVQHIRWRDRNPRPAGEASVQNKI